MKKILLIAALSVVLSACGTNNKNLENTDNSVVSANKTVTQEDSISRENNSVKNDNSSNLDSNDNKEYNFDAKEKLEDIYKKIASEDKAISNIDFNEDFSEIKVTSPNNFLEKMNEHKLHSLAQSLGNKVMGITEGKLKSAGEYKDILVELVDENGEIWASNPNKDHEFELK
ncbi:MAG: hypothetical protein Q4B52_07035 [Tissierellia bacterium]|nr:hypothetical protein [Tissierellia bacterium]